MRARSVGTGPEGSRETATTTLCRDPSGGGVKGGITAAGGTRDWSLGESQDRRPSQGQRPDPAPRCTWPGVPLHVSTHTTLEPTRERRLPLEVLGRGREEVVMPGVRLQGQEKGVCPPQRGPCSGNPTRACWLRRGQRGQLFLRCRVGASHGNCRSAHEKATTRGLQAELPGINTF